MKRHMFDVSRMTLFGCSFLLLNVASMATGQQMVDQSTLIRVGHSFLQDPVVIHATYLVALAAFILFGRYRVGLSNTNKRSFSEKDQNRLLIDALNKIDLCVVIYDDKFRAVHWNEATTNTFPKLVPLLQNGETLQNIIAHSYKAGVTDVAKTTEDAIAFAQRVWDKVAKGQDASRVVKMADGRVFEAVEFKFGRGLYASVRKDVTKDQELTECIHDQNVQLAIANERMQHFSEMAAHDLRAPLQHQATLLSFIQEDFEADGVTLPPETVEHMKLSQASLLRMMRLVDDLLEYARSDTTQTVSATVNLEDRLQQVLPLVMIPDDFSVTYDAPLPSIRVPEAACDIVLRNLISNAIKHHDDTSGHVHITADVFEKTVVVSISDNGPGIRDEHKQRVFEPFQRLLSSEQTQGSGLGLAMVARTIENWGGAISVKDAPGGGSIFVFTAPLDVSGKVPADLEETYLPKTGTDRH